MYIMKSIENEGSRGGYGPEKLFTKSQLNLIVISVRLMPVASIQTE